MLATMATLMMPAPAPTMAMNPQTLPLGTAKPGDQAGLKTQVSIQNNNTHGGGQKQGKDTTRRLVQRQTAGRNS